MRRKILIGLLGVVILFVLVAFALPRVIMVERSVILNRPPHTVYTMLSTFRGFNRWSPWAELDPNTKYRFSGPDFGPGAKFSWSSTNPDVGSGSQTIVAIDPDQRIDIDLDFDTDGAGKSYFVLAPEIQGTRLTWGMSFDAGYNPFYRWLGVLVIKPSVGRDYDRGLVKLKKVVDSLPATPVDGLTSSIETVTPTMMVYISSESTTEPDAIGKALEKAYATLNKALAGHTAPSAPPLAISHSYGNGRYVFDAGLPVSEEVIVKPPVKLGETYAGRVLKVVHTGSYDKLSETYSKAEAFLAVTGLKAMNGTMDGWWEEYVTDPSKTADEKLVTNIYIPLSE